MSCSKMAAPSEMAAAGDEEYSGLLEASSSQLSSMTCQTPDGDGLDNSTSASALHRSKWPKLRTTLKVASAVGTSRRRQKRNSLVREDSFLKKFSTRQGVCLYRDPGQDEEAAQREHQQQGVVVKSAATAYRRFVIKPDENFMFYWLTVSTAAVLYNLWTSIAREAFPEIQEGYEVVWLCADVICDVIYFLDVVVQLRTGYLERGLIVFDARKLARHYVYSWSFVLDVLSLTPLDIVQIYVGIHPLVRFPRFLKSYRLHRFVHMVETRTIYPNMWRVVNLTHLLFLGSHWFAAFYFLISKAQNFQSHWGYPFPVGNYSSVAQKYLRSLYWSTLTLTTIGDLSPPESNWEHVFTIVSYLIGVFVFATIVGQVGNVITNRNASRQEFERLLDGAKSYMRNHNVPIDMQRHVQRWYDYAWSRGCMNGGGDINALGLLPDKLKTELALHVHLDTLKKVTIFQECEPEFLHDLVLKMRTYIFTPCDLICRKGEVAREMFIIADGLLEVISERGEILTQMSTGDFFGEIGILNLDGGVNRRTADVRSVGYSELIVLSRDDVLSALKDHPEAEILIKEYGKRRLLELGAHNRKHGSVRSTHSVDRNGVHRRRGSGQSRTRDQTAELITIPFESKNNDQDTGSLSNSMSFVRRVISSSKAVNCDGGAWEPAQRRRRRRTSASKTDTDSDRELHSMAEAPDICSEDFRFKDGRITSQNGAHEKRSSRNGKLKLTTETVSGMTNLGFENCSRRTRVMTKTGTSDTLLSPDSANLMVLQTSETQSEMTTEPNSICHLRTLPKEQETRSKRTATRERAKDDNRKHQANEMELQQRGVTNLPPTVQYQKPVQSRGFSSFYVQNDAFDSDGFVTDEFHKGQLASVKTFGIVKAKPNQEPVQEAQLTGPRRHSLSSHTGNFYSRHSRRAWHVRDTMCGLSVPSLSEPCIITSCVDDQGHDEPGRMRKSPDFGLVAGNAVSRSPSQTTLNIVHLSARYTENELPRKARSTSTLRKLSSREISSIQTSAVTDSSAEAPSQTAGLAGNNMARRNWDIELFGHVTAGDCHANLPSASERPELAAETPDDFVDVEKLCDLIRKTVNHFLAQRLATCEERMRQLEAEDVAKEAEIIRLSQALRATKLQNSATTKPNQN